MTSNPKRLFALVCATLVGLTAPVTGGPEPEELVVFENAVRAKTDWGSRARANLGPNPFKILATPVPGRWVGLLGGADAVVLLDENGREHDRAPTPPSPTGFAFTPSGQLVVVGEQRGEIAHYDVDANEVTRQGSRSVSGTHSLRDIAVLGDTTLVLDAVSHRIVALGEIRDPVAPRTVAPCEGPVAIVALDDLAIANCLLEGALVVIDPGGHERARIVHDGPLWSMAGLRDHGDLLIAAGGVENRPLDRSDGGFGYIDSFAFVYRVTPKSGVATLLGEVNLSALGVVTPKWLELLARNDGFELRVAGYASEGLVSLDWPGGDLTSEPEVSRMALPPGTTDVAGPLAANPLLDSWVLLRAPNAPVVAEPKATRSAESMVGEALFFTTLMAPWNTSEGPRSRFTCETCHHEGYVDGRTHSTGRGDVHATTKPLVGLHGNRPYFSRALDPTMARMVHNEFRVANKHNGRDPWFGLDHADVAWMPGLHGATEALSPVWLRRALMTFLMELEHLPNPAVSGRSAFTPLEHRGAVAFRERCEGCHAARLVSDDAETHVAFADWEANLFTGGTIIWGREGYEKTGITPYVHPRGARVPSLRRLYRKRPYFTNGSAPDLDAVLARITTTTDGPQHTAKAPERPLSGGERASLLAFLGLL